MKNFHSMLASGPTVSPMLAIYSRPTPCRSPTACKTYFLIHITPFWRSKAHAFQLAGVAGAKQFVTMHLADFSVCLGGCGYRHFNRRVCSWSCMVRYRSMINGIPIENGEQAWASVLCTCTSKQPILAVADMHERLSIRIVHCMILFCDGQRQGNTQ